MFVRVCERYIKLVLCMYHFTSRAGYELKVPFKNKHSMGTFKNKYYLRIVYNLYDVKQKLKLQKKDYKYHIGFMVFSATMMVLSFRNYKNGHV